MTVKRVLFLVLVGMLCTVVVTILNAQQQGKTGGSAPGILHEKKAGEGIETGTVVAFGEKLAPPYYVMFERDTVFVNGIAYLPTVNDPDRKTRVVKATEQTVQRNALLQAIENRYVEEYKVGGRAAAESLVAAQYSGHPLISTLTYDGSELMVRFKDGHAEHVLLDTFERSAEGAYPAEADIVRQRSENVQRLKDFLQSGGMLAFGDRYSVMIPRQSASEIVDAATRAGGGTLSRSEASTRITHLAGSSVLAKDVMSRLSTWR